MSRTCAVGLLMTALIGACIPSGYVDGGADTNTDVPQGPFVLFHGGYTVPFGEDVSYPQSVLVAVESARAAAGAYAWNDVSALVAPTAPLGLLLATLDADFGASAALPVTVHPSLLVADAITAGTSATDASSRAGAAAQLDAALQVTLLFAFEHEVQAAVIEAADVSRLPPGIDDAGTGDAGTGVDVPQPCEDGGVLGTAFDGNPVGPDGGDLSVNDAAIHWDFAALYLSGIEADIRAINVLSGTGVFCAGTCAISTADLAGGLIGALGRGQAAYTDAANAPALGFDASPYYRAVTEEAATVRWEATRPFMLGALAHVAMAESVAGSAADVGVAQMYAASVLSIVAAREANEEVDSAVTQAWATWSPNPMLPMVLDQFGPVFAGVAGAAYAEYVGSLCTCGSEQDLDRWEALAGSAAIVDVVADALTFVAQDPGALEAALEEARADTDGAGCTAPLGILGAVPAAIGLIADAGAP